VAKLNSLYPLDYQSALRDSPHACSPSHPVCLTSISYQLNVGPITKESRQVTTKKERTCVSAPARMWMPILKDASIDSVTRDTSTQIDENRLAMLALTLTPNLGPKRILDAIAQLQTPGQIFALTLTELEGLRFPADAAQFIFDGKARRVADEEWGKIAQQGATIITLGCAEYPERLKEIYDPPPVLWVRGAVQLLSRPSIAVVGTRHPSPYGTSVAEMLSRDLSARRLVIVSGMARGIDTCAHRGALAARTSTVAVWGTRNWQTKSSLRAEPS
jgi:hypothetical protein